MKIKILPVISLLALCACNSSYQFVQISDTQLGFFEHPYGTFVKTEADYKAAVERINEIKPAMVFNCGDLCDQSQLWDQYEAYQAITSTIQAPYYPVPGNHDIQDGYTPEKLAEYQRKFGPERFAFKYKGSTFIGFDSNRIQNGYQPDETEQYEWLRERLAEARGSRHIFLFCHCPIIYGLPDQEEDYFNFPEPYRRKYLDLLDEFGVDYVFNGHTHHVMYNEYNDVKMHIAGSTGNNFEGTNPGFHLVTVTRDWVKVEWVETYSR